MEIVINLCSSFKLREECNILKIDTFEILATFFLSKEGKFEGENYLFIQSRKFLKL